jgi:4-hydroxybenzoyl-CoA thioesterase/acyl-CoA thioester hydrolase
MSPFSTRRRVEFSDTDMGGVVHFSRFFVFMETAEHQFLGSLGVEVDTVVDGRRVSWPRVAARCEYLRPAHFGDELDIQVRVLKRGEKSMTYAYLFCRGEQEIARGEMTAVCCAVEEGGRLEAIPIPPSMARRLETAEGEQPETSP